MLHTQAHDVVFFRSTDGASDGIGQTAHQVTTEEWPQVTAFVDIHDLLRVQRFG